MGDFLKATVPRGALSPAGKRKAMVALASMLLLSSSVAAQASRYHNNMLRKIRGNYQVTTCSTLAFQCLF